jgi:hypothetical protein
MTPKRGACLVQTPLVGFRVSGDAVSGDAVRFAVMCVVRLCVLLA